MYSLLLSSVHGGTGNSTVTANLAAALQLQGFKTLSLDLNCDNALGLHYGVNTAECDGWLSSVVDGSNWREHVFESEDGRCVLPFGHFANAPDALYSRMLSESPKMATSLLADLLTTDFDVLLIDAPSVLHRSLLNLKSCDLQLLVCNPDIQSYTLLKRYGEFLLEGNTHIVLNKIQPDVPLYGDLGVLIREQFARQCVPVTIHLDYAVAQALAFFDSAIGVSPDCQGVKDFHSLALWCISTLKVAV